MGVLKFDIRYPTGHREFAVVEGERALIGSASHCDVRLPMDQAAYEHLLIEVSAGTVRAEARASQPPATINGMPLTSCAVSPDAALGAGQVRIYVVFAENAAPSDAPVTKDKAETSPLVRLVALIAVPVAGYMLLLDPAASLDSPPTVDPQLFANAPTSCPQATGERAVAMAEEKLDQAIGKRERAPFAPGEGVAAVGLFETAAVCFKAGGRVDQAKDAAADAAQLRSVITRDMRSRRLRLSQMLKLHDDELAERDVKQLESLTRGKQGPFVTWLASVRTELNARRSIKK